VKTPKIDIFESENALLAKVKETLALNYFESVEIRQNFESLINGYESMLSQMRRMINISDRTENRLFKSNCQLNDAQAAISEEKNKYEKLLLSVFPETIGRELLQNREVIPRRFENATVMFTDFVNFTQLTASIDPELLIRELNDVFCAFDLIMLRNDCGRIKTIGDGYMAVCGVPNADGDHARKILKSAVECLKYLHIRNTQLSGKSLGICWGLRIGINSGPVVGGIVGTQHFSYDIFGDTVNMASRIEQQANVNGIALSESTKALIGGQYECAPLGVRTIKGKGDIPLFTIVGEKQPAGADDVEMLEEI